MPVSVDCGIQIPRVGGTNRLFAEIPGFTVSEICLADADPSFATSEVDSRAAGLVSQNGNPILRVLAGRLKSGSGDAFTRTYLENLSAQARDKAGVPSETEQLGGHLVSHFNIPLVTDGYVYADGRTVVIANVAAGAPPAAVEDALTEILDNQS